MFNICPITPIPLFFFLIKANYLKYIYIIRGNGFCSHLLHQTIIYNEAYSAGLSILPLGEFFNKLTYEEKEDFFIKEIVKN